MCCVCTAIYIGPHLLYANRQGGPHPPPPPQGAEEGIGRSARLPGQYCCLGTFNLCVYSAELQ
jgi:hypothetical protein